MTRPVRRRRSFAVRVWSDGVTTTGAAGVETDENGRVGSRTCPDCGFRLDDVGGRGAHPDCQPTGGRPTAAAGGL